MEFDDGFRVEIPEGAFNAQFDVTINKVEDSEPDNGLQPVTAAYTFATSDDELPAPDKELRFRVPTFVQLTRDTALELGSNPGEEFPSPGNWVPQPDVPAEPGGGPPGSDDPIKSVDATVTQLTTFQVYKKEEE